MRDLNHEILNAFNVSHASTSRVVRTFGFDEVRYKGPISRGCSKLRYDSICADVLEDHNGK